SAVGVAIVRYAGIGAAAGARQHEEARMAIDEVAKCSGGHGRDKMGTAAPHVKASPDYHRPMRNSPEEAEPASRPLRLHAEAELAARWKAALAEGDGLLGAHCIHEQWMRGPYPAQIEAALEALWARAARTIPDWLPMRYISWLPVVYEVA